MQMDDAHEEPAAAAETVPDRSSAKGSARRRILSTEAALAAAIGLTEFAVMQRIYVIEELQPGGSSVMWGPYLVLWAASYVALAFRRIRPLVVFFVTSGCLLLATLLQDMGPDELLPIAFWIALFTLVRRQRLLPSLATLVGALSVSVLQAYLVTESPLRALLGQDDYWVNPDPWYSHLELVWLTAAIYVIACCSRVGAALRHRGGKPE